MAVLATVSTAISTYSTSNSRSASVSDTRQKAYAAAESGINSAVSILGLGTNNALDPCLLHPPTNPSGYTCASNAALTVTVDNGTVSFGTFAQTQQLWTLTSKASFPNPTGSATRIKQTLHATVPITANQNDPANTAIWNYIISTKTSDATTCDM